MEGENSLPQVPSAGYMCTMARAHPCTSTYRHKYAGKINGKTKQNLWHCCQSDTSEQSESGRSKSQVLNRINTCSGTCKYTWFVGTQFLYSSIILTEKICYFKVLQNDTLYSHVLYVPNTTKRARHGGTCL